MLPEWLTEFIGRGGFVLYGVLLAALLLWSLILERLWFFYRDQPRLMRLLEQRWQQRGEHQSWQARRIRQYWLSEFRAQGERWLSLIAVLIAVCPLLGLLGTVTGMISVFDVLAVTGTGNARAMASGISQATLPTMAGLVVALSGLYFKSRFSRLSTRNERHLNERLSSHQGLELRSGNHG